jgi:hypothetical protein
MDFVQDSSVSRLKLQYVLVTHVRLDSERWLPWERQVITRYTSERKRVVPQVADRGGERDSRFPQTVTSFFMIFYAEDYGQ